MNTYPPLIVVAPLLGALLSSLVSWIEDRLSYPIALISLGVSVAASIMVLFLVLSSGTISYKIAGWSPPIGIEYRIDLLNAMVLVLVSSIAFLNLVASFPNVAQETPDKAPSFYAIYQLFVVGLLGVVITGDLFNLYVLIEITSLTSYTQIGMGDKKRGPLAALNYIFIGVIGASFYLLGVGYIYIKTGTLNMMDVAGILPQLQNSSAIFTAFVLCMVGIWIKMALFPVHVWLPNAYTFAPTAFSRVVAPLMTKVMVYVMVRLMITVFGIQWIFDKLLIVDAVVWIGTIAILAGAIMALYQKNLKKMLTYVIVCEIGYMVGGAFLGNQTGMAGTILHILNDALMTFALFLAVGNINYCNQDLDFTSLSGMFSKMPWTMAGLVLAACSILGVPPTCGFFSKWYLILGALEKGAYHFAAALVISSLICAILFFRVFEICFFSNTQEGHGHHENTMIQEAPAASLAVLGIVSIALIGMGLGSGQIIQRMILPFLG